MTIKKLIPLIAITAAFGAGAAPSSQAATGAGDVPRETSSLPYSGLSATDDRAPRPVPMPAGYVAKCEKLWEHTYICQVKTLWGTSEYLCDTRLNLCVKQ